MRRSSLQTQLGYKFYLRYGKQYVELEHYELNPLWQKSLEKKGRIFSVRYVLVLLLAGVCLVGVYAVLPHLAAEVLLGFFCGVYITINLTHLNNIFNTYPHYSVKLPSGLG